MYRAGRQVVGAWTAALVACAALGLSGCSSSKSDDEAEAREAPSGLEKYYSQELDWKPCGDQPDFSSGNEEYDDLVELTDLECAWLTVPVDYDDPSGATIDIAVARAVADDSQGSVVVNPGGPGGSGVNFVSDVRLAGGDTLVASLDVVGFDPRGVGRSAPVDCLSDDDLDAYLSADVDTSTDAGVAEARAANSAYVQGCKELTGPVLEHVDTISAARDVDVLRAALGETTLTYLGFSYGTQLGATYAQLFPEKVGRMVLDGAVDMTSTPGDMQVFQAGGFESALRAYVEDCLSDAETCPLSGSTDEAMAQVAGVIDQASASPIDTPTRQEGTGDDQVLTGSMALTGVLGAMYSEDLWPVLTEGLRMAIDEQDGSYIVLLADLYYERCDGMFVCDVEDGYYSNQEEANTAISCADSRDDADPQELADRVQAILAAAPTLGRFFADGVAEGLSLCADWPYPVADPLPSYAAEGAPPIVVIGTTNDPATPYAWAQALASTLDSGVLVTNEGEGHGGYLGGSECIQAAVDAYLVNGKVPENGLTCA